MLGIGIWPVEHLLRCQPAREVQAAGRTTPRVLTFITYVNFGKALSRGCNFKNVSLSRAGWSDARPRPSRDGGPADFDSTCAVGRFDLWGRPFNDPIEMDGRKLVTLRDAGRWV
jgi:hypothetical protein